MFFPLSQHFSSSSFFSTSWILSQQRISTLSCLLAMLLLLLWYDCYVCVCVSLCVCFFSVWMWVLFAALFSLAISVRNGAPTTRNLSFFYNATVSVYFRLLRMQKNVIPFFLVLLFLNLLSIQYLNLILLSFVWVFVRVDGGVCGNAWLLTVTCEYVWVSCLFCLWMYVSVSASIYRRNLWTSFLLNKRWKKEFEFITFFYPSSHW